MKKEETLIENYTYLLTPERIAHHPLEKRDASKLLVYKSGKMEEDRFYNLPQHLPSGSTLILNNTRVIEARIFFTKPTGGVIEIFCLAPFRQSMEISLQLQGSAEWECLIGGASKWKPGQVLSKDIIIEGTPVTLEARYVEKREDDFVIRFNWMPEYFHFVQVLHAAGAIPLPPYIKRNAEEPDAERYQTIFAREEGSVAAPTAALHFTEEVFENLKKKNIAAHFITLNVGAGTFKPVKTPTIAEHKMHSETFTVKKQTIEAILHAETVIAVGTTSLRTIESLHWLGVKLMKGLLQDEWSLEQWEAYDLDNSISYRQTLQALLNWIEEHQQQEIHCRTSLLIVPGYEFKIPSGLITNFHQPQSTLLLLVAAFIGEDWKKVYDYALENDFRFLSYGDSSLLWRNPASP